MFMITFQAKYLHDFSFSFEKSNNFEDKYAFKVLESSDLKFIHSNLRGPSQSEFILGFFLSHLLMTSLFVFGNSL